MTDFKQTVYWKIYGDVFAFHKKYAEVREDDLYWSSLVDEASELYGKYENVSEKEFAKQLILTVLEELERIYRGKRKEVEK